MLATKGSSKILPTIMTRPLRRGARRLFSKLTDNDSNNHVNNNNNNNGDNKSKRNLMGKPLQKPVGSLFGSSIVHDDDDDEIDDDKESSSLSSSFTDSAVRPTKSKYFIPQVALHQADSQQRKRVLLLCTGGTLTMAPDENGALAPVQGALINYLEEMRELHEPTLPEVVAHEYQPFYDSSDLGPADWATLASDIKANYLHFDGFVVCMGTDTMAYTATALSFMLENLGKPVVFTGSQIPLCEPHNDARRNLIMALIFASRDTINEVSIFFHDRLLRACRSTKVHTHSLLAFDSPKLEPLAKIGITIDENEHLVSPPARGALRVHTRMETRLLTLHLVPGFDDGMIKSLIENAESDRLLVKALVLKLYGTGNIPSVKDSFVQLLADANDKGILVVAGTQCHTGHVMMGHYATGRVLQEAGVVSGCDMTIEAIACKIGYLFGRGDLTKDQIRELMGVSLRGEVTPLDALSPPPFSNAYQRAMMKKGKLY